MVRASSSKGTNPKVPKVPKVPKAPKAQKAPKKEKMSSVKLQQKAAGYMLAAANAAKNGR